MPLADVGGDVTGSTTGPDDGVHAERLGHYEAAAKLAVDAHPLPGEDLETSHVDDAQMWVAVYTELLEFKQVLIRDTERALESLPPPGHEEVRKTDAVILAAEAQRFRQRLALWEQRLQELRAG